LPRAAGTLSGRSSDKIKTMRSRAGRLVVLGLGMIAVFASVAMLLTRIIPPPHKETDYLVIGTLATFASLGLLFVVLLSTFLKNPTVSKERKP
jgi:MFS family permease